MAEGPGDDIISQQAAGDHRSSLQELDQIPDVAPIWYRLGLQLGVRSDILDEIKNNYPQDAKCKTMMFTEWMSSDTDPTYEKVVRALDIARKGRLLEPIIYSAQGDTMASYFAKSLTMKDSQRYHTGTNLTQEILTYRGNTSGLESSLISNGQSPVSVEYVRHDDQVIKAARERVRIAREMNDVSRDSVKIIQEKNEARRESVKIIQEENEAKRESVQVTQKEVNLETELHEVLLKNKKLREERKQVYDLTHPGEPADHDSCELQAAPSDPLKDKRYKTFEKTTDREAVHFECPVCNKRFTEFDRKCEKCDLPYDQCKKSSECGKYSPRMIINSHAFPKAWLKRACGSKDRVIFDARTVSHDSPGTFKVKLLCNTCDNSTSSMEEKMLSRLATDYEETACEATKIHTADADLLHIITFRGFLININIRHYRDSACSCACKKHFEVLSNFLHNAQKLCQIVTRKENVPPRMVPPHEAEMFFYFEKPVACKNPRLIEFPLVCEINLHDIDDDLGSCAMIYAQFPPLGCYWAFPLESTKTAQLQPHFSKIIERVNDTLSKKREEYYASYGKPQQWLDAQKVPQLILHYLPECCLKIE